MSQITKENTEQILYEPRELFPISRKEKFLRKLRGKQKKYKRYLGSPLRYAGGKSWAVGYVIEYIPENINRLISPFFGVAR